MAKFCNQKLDDQDPKSNDLGNKMVRSNQTGKRARKLVSNGKDHVTSTNSKAKELNKPEKSQKERVDLELDQQKNLNDDNLPTLNKKLRNLKGKLDKEKKNSVSVTIHDHDKGKTLHVDDETIDKQFPIDYVENLPDGDGNTTKDKDEVSSESDSDGETGDNQHEGAANTLIPSASSIHNNNAKISEFVN